jgi:elongation factor Ts
MMADYTAADVKALRERTGAGMLDCRNALAEANGDVEKAIEILRIRGQKGVEKRSGRATTAGLVAVRIEGDEAHMIELASETDFVAKNERFAKLADDVLAFTSFADRERTGGKSVKEFIDAEAALLGEKIELRQAKVVKGEHFAVYLHKTSKDLPPQVGVVVGYKGENEEIARQIAQHIAFAEPLYFSKETVPAEEVAKERDVLVAAAREQGKPERAVDQIVEGQLNAFYKRIALLEQPFARDPKRTVFDVLIEAGLLIQDFGRIKVGA